MALPLPFHSVQSAVALSRVCHSRTPSPSGSHRSQEVHQPSAPNQHRRLSVGPGRTIAVPREERVQRAICAGWCIRSDPLAPGQGPRSDDRVSPLPVEDSRDLQGSPGRTGGCSGRNPHARGPRRIPPATQAVSRPATAHGSARGRVHRQEHVRCPAGVHQVLTVRACTNPSLTSLLSPASWRGVRSTSSNTGGTGSSPCKRPRTARSSSLRTSASGPAYRLTTTTPSPVVSLVYP